MITTKNQKQDDLARLVEALTEKDAKHELESFLRKHPEEKDVFIRKYAKDDLDFYKDALRSSLDRIVSALIASLAADDEKPDWEDDDLTDVSSYIDQMIDLIDEGSAVLPLEDLLYIAIDAGNQADDNTAFDSLSDPVNALYSLMAAVPVAYIKRDPKRKDAVLKKYADCLLDMEELNDEDREWYLNDAKEELKRQHL